VNAYAYTFDDPVNTSDLSGQFTESTSGWLFEFAAEVGQEAAARQAAIEAAERAEAEARARAAAEAAALSLEWGEEEEW
jgi:hypothetical protein